MIRKSFAAGLLAGTVLFAPAAALAKPVDADAAVLALAEPPLGQLTDAVTPTAYRVDNYFDPALKGFTGRTEIDIDLKKSSNFIDLHGRNLEMTSIVARPADGGAARWTGTWHQLDDTGVARITFPEALPAGKLTLDFVYAGQFQEGPSGLFHAEVDGKWYGWSQFESIDARAAFPSFDQPSFKVPFTVTLRTRPGEVAVSNAPEVSNTLENGWQVHRFAPTLPLPTYLVAMMAGPFAVAESEVPPTPQRAKPLPLRIVTPHTNADKMAYALEESKPIVALLESYFGQAFPYPKLDQISSPLMGGAMENAGADLYADGILILDENAPLSQRKTFGMVVAHELAHQWFGDLVTPVWWDDIWLNESFANWMGFTIGGQWKPDYGIGDGALGEGFAAMRPDSLLTGRPIHQAIATNDQIDSAFDGITYGKGGHVVSMIAAYMGPDKFRDGVRKYMTAHRYGNATSKDFFSAMAEAAGDPRITAAMQSFTDQQGVPLVTIAGADGKYTISQSRYAPIGVDAPATSWGIPVCMRRGETRNCTLLSDASAPFTIGGSGALMPNAGGTGYYRFELPAGDWDRLIATADTLSAAEAMALSDSLSASFQAGHATTAQLAALAQKLYANPDQDAAKLALGLLGRFSNPLVVSEEAIAAYRGWVGRLVAAEYAELGLNPKLGAYAGQDPVMSNRRQRLLGALRFAREATSAKILADAAGAYIAGDQKALDPSYMGAAFDAYVNAGGLPAAKALAEMALGSSDSQVRQRAFGAIYGSGKLDIARWAMEEFNDPRLRTMERTYGALYVAQTDETREYGYKWVDANIEKLMAGAGGIFMARALPSAVGGFCSVEQANAVETRFAPVFAGTPGAIEMQRVLENIRNCAAFKAARGAEVEAALKAL